MDLRFTRRDVLVDGLRVAVALPALPGLARRALVGTGDPGARVLVVVQLTGGNDGLNTVVPHRQDAYFRARPTLAHPRGALHALDDDHGLHPAMRGLGELFADGRLAVVHGMGYPRPDRSHFRSMEVWHGADPVGPAADTGWLGRLADQVAARDPGALPAVHVGSADLPLSLRGERVLAPSVRDARSFELRPARAGLEPLRDAVLDVPDGGAELAHLRGTARAAYDVAARVAELSRAENPVDYPGTPLARRLRLVARLITGGFGTRVFQVEHAGFDTHVRQARVHAELLGELSAALTAFQRDLEQHGAGDRVVTFAFSEFGRRVRENGSRGTDHGAGAPALLLGTRVRPGLHGTPPDLERLEDGDVPFTTDFRSVYTCLERDWMDLTPSTDLPPIALLS